MAPRSLRSLECATSTTCCTSLARTIGLMPGHRQNKRESRTRTRRRAKAYGPQVMRPADGQWLGCEFAFARTLESSS